MCFCRGTSKQASKRVIKDDLICWFATDLVFVIDAKNRIDFKILKSLGFDTDNSESIKFDGKGINDQIVYTDLAGTMSEMTGGIMDGITIVLIAFAAISLVVSLIMICIITYTSVLERTKEIGILRALGARKKDITRVFDAETCILGVFSGVLGIAIAWLLTIPINAIIYNMAELSGVAHLQVPHAVILVAISTVLAILGGHIPAKMASKKDAVEALRSE